MRTGSATPSARRARVLRALAASTTATFAALGSHLAAGGAVPSAPALVAVLVLCWPPAVALVGRRAGGAGLAAVIAASELAFHAAFTVLGTAGAAHASPGGMPGMPGMPAAPILLAPGAALPAAPAMWFAHGLAAALTWLLCRRGESALVSLLAVLARLVLPVLPGLAASASVGPAVRLPDPPVRPRSATPARARPLRGPPVPAIP